MSAQVCKSEKYWKLFRLSHFEFFRFPITGVLDSLIHTFMIVRQPGGLQSVSACFLPAVGSLARVLSKALVMDWNKFIFWVGPLGEPIKLKKWRTSHIKNANILMVFVHSAFGLLNTTRPQQNSCSLTRTNCNHSQRGCRRFANKCCLIYKRRQTATMLPSIWMNVYQWAQLERTRANWLPAGCILVVFLQNRKAQME